jgi:hypothetical protein
MTGRELGGGREAPVALPVVIRYGDVLHFLGYPSGRRPPKRIEQRIRPLLREARALVEARGAYRHLPLADAPQVGLEVMPASGLVIGLVTAGARLEERISELTARGETTDALILDSMGSAAAEEAADRLGACIVNQRPAADAKPDPATSVASLSCRISPGYGRWPLTAQASLFERLPGQALGIKLLPSLLMVPRKSISFAMWMGADARPIAGLSGCENCNLERCQYRLPREDRET